MAPMRPRDQHCVPPALQACIVQLERKSARGGVPLTVFFNISSFLVSPPRPRLLPPPPPPSSRPSRPPPPHLPLPLPPPPPHHHHHRCVVF